MSTAPPPDGPTDPLRPPGRARIVEERVVAPAIDPGVLLVRLEDAVGSLRTGLTIVGVIAVAALAIALYALLSDDNTSARGGSRSGLASDARVSKLQARLNRISRQLQSQRASAGDTTALSDRIGALERTVRMLSSRPTTTGTDPTQVIEQLSRRVDALSRDVEQLKTAQTNP